MTVKIFLVICSFAGTARVSDTVQYTVVIRNVCPVQWSPEQFVMYCRLLQAVAVVMMTVHFPGNISVELDMIRHKLCMNAS